MGADLVYLPLEKLVDASRGISYGVVQPGQPVDDGVPVIRVTDIRGGRVDTTAPLRVSAAVAAKHQRTVLRGGELLLTLVGTVGETAVVSSNLAGWNTARAVAVVPVLEDPGPRWVQYALRTGGALEYILSRVNTTVQATLNLRDVALLPIPMPIRAVREAILRILGTLDDKIELNRQMNETLEAMARTLFKSWFVDFDPVRAKAEGRQPTGMDAATAELFPSDFVESELGPIPEGWPIVKLGQMLELKRGYDLPMAQRLPGAVPIISSSGLSGLHNEAKAHAPGIVTGRYGTIGVVYYVREDFWPLNTTLYVRDFKGADVLYAYHLLRLLDFRKFSDKAAVPGVNRNDLHEEAVVGPPVALQQRFASIAGAWLDLAAQCIEQTRVLTELRDALLPKLLSGELTADVDMPVGAEA